jgi:transcriptional regulator with XRE-family HTH domain
MVRRLTSFWPIGVGIEKDRADSREAAGGKRIDPAPAGRAGKVSQSFISILEGGKIESIPPPMILERLAQALDVKPEALSGAS